MWFLLVAVAVLFAVILHVVFPRNYLSPRDYWYLSKIPGLPGLPYFGNVQIFLIPNEEFLPVLTKLCDTHKPIFKIDALGEVHVFLTDIHDLSVIFNSRQHTEKSIDYLFLLPWLNTGLLTSHGQKWLQRRKLLTPAFHFQILEQYIDILDKHARILVDKLRRHVCEDYVEINPLMSLCTLDVICETAMGTSVYAQTGGEKEYVKATLRMSQIIQKRMLTPWMYRSFIFDLMPMGREQKRLLKILHGFTEKVIRERKQIYRQNHVNEKWENENSKGVKKKTSFLDLMIKMSETENKMSDEEIREEVDTFMFEGHDTTAAALSWALFELGHNQDIQQKAYLEQCEIFQGSLRSVTKSDMQKMKYLERVIKETLRLYPSVPIISRRLETDTKIKGYTIPAGTNIPAFIYYIHRNPNLYPNPLVFDPDRFSPDTNAQRDPYAYIPFSAGSRNCIGQKFAEMEEKAILSHIIRNFQIISLCAKNDIKIMGELILRPKNNIRIALKARHPVCKQ